MKESVKLQQIAGEVKKIKRRFLLDQIGRGRPTTRSVSAQNARNNAPISTATRSHTVAAAGGNGGGGGDDDDDDDENRGIQNNRGGRRNGRGNRGNRGNRGGNRGMNRGRVRRWSPNRDRVGLDTEGLHRYVEEYE